MSTTSWDILICSIEHRTEQLAALLDTLGGQLQPGVRILVYRDNLEVRYGEKCQALLDRSDAEYVCFIDDDDSVHPDYVQRIVDALAHDPDYVGFCVAYTEDGERQVPVVHSLKCEGWVNGPDALLRDIVHFNPIRRSLALRARWAGGNGADRRWADELRAQNCVQSEVYVPAELYCYRHSSGDTFCAPREPLVEHPPRPEHEFVTWL